MKYHQKGYRVQKLYLLREIIESRNCTPTIYSHMGGYLLRSRKRENEQQNKMNKPETLTNESGTKTANNERTKQRQVKGL